MEKIKVENQTYQQKKTHGRTTNRISNKDKQQTDYNNYKALRLVSLTKLDDDPIEGTS